MTRAGLFLAIERSIEAASPGLTPREQALIGLEACLLILTKIVGTEGAADAAYAFADTLATAPRFHGNSEQLQSRT